jgi:D-amino peptidase
VKVYISVDIEGATGVVSFSQCGRPSGEHFDFAFARRMLTHDVNAAIHGARAGGATEIVVKDSHAGCKNLLIDELEPAVRLISGIGAGTNGMMEGIDETFDAAMLVGYHAMSGALGGMMEHALVGGLHKFWLNGELAGEIAVSAASAGAFGVPLVMVSSDEAGCAETRAVLPGTITYATKAGIGKYMGELKHPSETGPGIEAAAREAVRARQAIEPYRAAEPCTMTMEFRTTNEADLAATLEGVNRLDGYTVELTRDTFLLAHQAAYAVFAMSVRGRASEA